jgi:NAD(P)-dependent dehydrogenase (short-subunit alcohol dehydrogenase family)
MLLKDRIAIVSGIGPGAFARAGAHVVLAARRQALLDEVAAEVRALGRDALCVPTDISEKDQCLGLVQAAQQQFERVDVLVNNAFMGGVEDPIERVDLELWRRIYDVNVIGSVQLTQAVVPLMKAQGGGSVVMVNSMSMRIIEPRFGGYAASKGALMAATQTLAKELGAHKIRVNSVVPGYIWGKSLEGYFKMLAQQQGTTPQKVYDSIASRTALHHIPTSEEIADAVLFFASDLSRVITGQALDVNGGHFFH